MTTPVLSAIAGTNADLFAEVYRLYISPKDKVVDLNYGKGVFWKNISHKNVWKNDLHLDADTNYDCRYTEFKDNSFQVAVLDPPYKTGTSAPMRDDHDGYGNNQRTGKGIAAVRSFYLESIIESHRILKPAGLLMVKTMDQVESGKNHWLHIDVFEQLEMVGFQVIDLFVLLRKSSPPMRHNHQTHARKSHSYLWVGRKKT